MLELGLYSALRPNIVLCLFKVARERIYRLPSTSPHDCGRIKAFSEQVLSGAYAQGMPAEFIHDRWVQSVSFRRGFNHAFDRSCTQIPIDRLPLIYRAKQKRDMGPTPFEPVFD